MARLRIGRASLSKEERELEAKAQTLCTIVIWRAAASTGEGQGRGEEETNEGGASRYESGHRTESLCGVALGRGEHESAESAESVMATEAADDNVKSINFC